MTSLLLILCCNPQPQLQSAVVIFKDFKKVRIQFIRIKKSCTVQKLRIYFTNYSYGKHVIQVPLLNPVNFLLHRLDVFSYYVDSSFGFSADVNECTRSNGGCEHKCNNTIGSYRCSCHDGFMLVGRHMCNGKPQTTEPFILTTGVPLQLQLQITVCYWGSFLLWSYFRPNEYWNTLSIKVVIKLQY